MPKVIRKPPIISYEQINHLLDSYHPSLREHDGLTFAIEVANCQRDAEMTWKAKEVACQSRLERIFKEIETLHLFQGDCPPIEGKNYVYLGDYILRYGKNLEPQVGFNRLSDNLEWQALKEQEGIE